MAKRDAEVEVLEVAVELHAQDEAAKEAALAREAAREAAAELGVEAEHLERAEAEVARRRAQALERRTRMGRIARWAAAGVLAIGLGIGAWQVATPDPPEPWAEEVADDVRWVLDTSPGTMARLDFETDGDREMAVVTVARAQPRQDGTWFVNLDGMGLPSFEGHEALVIELSGTLPTARVYLEAGSDERWRSPPIPVQASWTRHRLPLSAFEHQRRQDGEWRVVEADDPEGVGVVSVKLGHFINPPEAHGELRVREIGAE